MNSKRWFAWLCLALVLVAEVALFRSYREKDAIQSNLINTEVRMHQMENELNELRRSNAGLQASEILRLRKQNEILTNELTALRATIGQLSEESSSNAQHLATARAAFKLQQEHLEQLQGENQQILDASVAIIAKKNCFSNLRAIDDAKQQWAADNDEPNSAVPTEKDLLPYLKDKAFPVCPSGGTYSINSVDELPTCSIHGHVTQQ